MIHRRSAQLKSARIPNGFILMPVVMAITLLAAIAFLLNRDSAMNANQLASEAAKSQASLVAKAGLNHLLWQANQANCTGYSDLNSVGFGNGSYTASISPTSNSPVHI